MPKNAPRAPGPLGIAGKPLSVPSLPSISRSAILHYRAKISASISALKPIPQTASNDFFTCKLLEVIQMLTLERANLNLQARIFAT